MIHFNVPPVVGTEKDYIAQAINMILNLVLEFFYDKYFVFNDKN